MKFFSKKTKSLPGEGLTFGKSNKKTAQNNKPLSEVRSLTEGCILIAGGSLVDFEAAERFRMLRAQLERKDLAADKTEVLAVTSAVPSEGKSVTTVNLSRGFASDPSGKTIIVDCDLRKPNVHRFFSEASVPGLSDLLVAGKALDTVVREVEPGLDIICAGSPVVDSTRAIESEGLGLLLEELKKRYKHVVLDCPPVLMCSEVLAISQVATSTLLVARAWRTERQLVQEAAAMLREYGLIGVVLNECTDSLRHYGYYGYYGYMGVGKSDAAVKASKGSFSTLR